MAEITGEIENIDKLFSEININGETHQSENYVEKETPVYQPAPEPVEEEPQLPPSEPVFVEREIEDISSLFSEINVNDTPHEQENYVEQHLPVYQPAPEPQEEEPFNPPPSVIGQDVTGIDLNSILHPIKDDNIGQQIETLNQAMQAIQQRMTELNALIPSQASASNKLADKAFVNSSVQTATANFRGNWNDFSSVPTDASLYPVDYAGSKTPTVNDYLVVQDASDYTEETLEGTWRFKYSGTWSVEGKNGWRPEYQVNETPLTQAQLEALNSGATASKISEIDNKNGIITINDDGVAFGDSTNFILGGNNVTNPTSFVRRTALALWNYIKGKVQAGLTMTGLLKMASNQYWEVSNGGLDMSNSDIVNANTIRFSDPADSDEGFSFPRADDTNRTDLLKVYNGSLIIKVNKSNIDGTGSGTWYLNKWIDVTDRITLTTNSSLGSYTITNKNFYLCGCFLKVDLTVMFNYAGSAGTNPLKLNMTSPLFTTTATMSRTYYSSFYGTGIWTVGFNVYSGESNIFTFRPNHSFVNGEDASFSGIIPVNLYGVN